MKNLRTLLVLGRVSNLPTVWTNLLAGWFLAGGGPMENLLGLAVGVSLLYIAGMTLNDAFDVGWDQKNAPERPIPSGLISAKATWLIGATQMIGGIAILLFLTPASPVFIMGLVAAILLYNWLHKRWTGSILIMGACRALVYFVAGSAAVGGAEAGFSLGFQLLAITMLLYIAGITLVARFERSENRKPVLFGQFLLFCPLVALLNLQEGLDVLGPTLLGIWIAWVIYCIVTIRQSIPRGVCVLLAGICLIDAVALASTNLTAAIVALAFLPLTLFFQKFIPAT